MLPPFLKAGFNLANPSKVVVPLIPSSSVTVTFFSFPSLSNTTVSKGTISSLNNPADLALAAFWWESTANWSYVCLVIPYFSATFSEVSPIPIKQSLASGCSNTASAIFSGSTADYISNMDMDSTPAPIPISIYPA